MEISCQAIEGYAYGARQPSVLLRTPLEYVSKKTDTRHLEKILHAAMESCERSGLNCKFPRAESLNGPLIFARIVAALNTLCGDQRFTSLIPFLEDSAYVIPIATCSTGLALHNMSAILDFLRKTEGSFSDEQLNSWFAMLRDRGRHFLPSGTNAMNFVSAAVEHDVPVTILQKDYLIFGYGSGCTIFKSSIIDTEPSIGVSFARSKVTTNKLLKMSGLPVADQASVQTIDQARVFANRIGYPVVLKPDIEAQGRGVYANIVDADELAACFEELKKKYPTLLIEKHITGHHYRIDFMGDDLIKAVRRDAPIVTGDGKSTVRQLIDILNLEPERSDPYSSKKPVLFDDDLERSLQKQNISLDDILSENHSVYLKSISNLSRGGSQVHVENEIHPENYELCKKIARIMRLEVLGIDILSRDLSKPWYTNGAAVCEVNAQPQLGAGRTEVYWNFLEKYLRSRARVELYVAENTEKITDTLFDTKSSTVSISISVHELLQTGCPTQYFDELVISDDVSEADRRKVCRLLACDPTTVTTEV